MGVEYALVHASTGQAYELGKNWGYEWREALPASLAEVRANVEEHFGDEPEAFREMLASEVWDFIEVHPGCRVESDTGDIWWGVRPVEDPSIWTETYRQVRSRYDVWMATRT